MRQFLRSPLGIALLICLSLGGLDFWAPFSSFYWNKVAPLLASPASERVVIVTMDEGSDPTTGDAAALLERIRREMPRSVFFDAKVAYGVNEAGDAQLARAIASFGQDFTYVVRSQKPDQFGSADFRLPPSQIVAPSQIAVSAWTTNFTYKALSAPYRVILDGREYPTVSTVIAGRHRGVQSEYYPDFSVAPATIPLVSGRSLREGRLPKGILAGRTVVLTSDQSAMVGYFGSPIVQPIAVDIAVAEALRKPLSLSTSFVPMLAMVALAVLATRRIRFKRLRALLYLLTVSVVIALPMYLRTLGIVCEPDGSVAFMVIYAGIRGWQKRTHRIQHTSLSGLPNLAALSSLPIEVGRDVVVVVVARYEEIMATLPRELHGEVARQIARRLSVGSGANEIYHGESGHFAWTEEARPLEMQLNHLEGLRALFSAPLQIGEHTFDTNIHFGLDRNEGLDASTRVNSALASANEALGNGRSIELFESQRLVEAPWELSLHARIEEGLRNGEIWLAFQPQWDFAQGRVSGAEALIRWNHPTRGPIAPDAFILQAERAGRIDTLTYWVLEEAISAALTLNALGPRFQMSINLSAQMVDKADLVTNFAEIVRRRGIEPSLLTIEVTETSSVRNRPAACHNLTRLREMGFRLSIDDFGTGEASLAYLADLPSDELKLDRRFVSRLIDSERDRVIITSTIALAHALHQSVVAEGIEDAATFALLREFGCDQAQGYYLGRPQPFAVFLSDYEAGRRYAISDV
ncbi:EAL domain-containing protein [Novosphingobium huizhouense]|uniref:EAL domain-containing protein n=1 Tax=Novosphingobium huizhouense TaxID=2866625 RepID=UPI001CD851AE|nr:EAL domain-containing protein [Novosphingobium huizhouense]